MARDLSDLAEHIPRLRRYARVLTGDPWAADDLVQDTLERACSRWRLWLAGSDRRAWLFTIMHNLYANQQRRLGVKVLAAQAQVPLDDPQLGGQLAAPDGVRDLALDLQRGLLRLPEDQRTTLLLVALEDLSYQEVARITGVPVGTVMSRLSRARQRLQEWLDAPAHPLPHPSATLRPQLRRLK